MSEISKDARAIMLDNQLRDLNTQRAKIRPALYILMALVGILLAIISLPNAVGFIAGIIGLASAMTAITSFSKIQRLNDQIMLVKAQIKNL